MTITPFTTPTSGIISVANLKDLGSWRAFVHQAVLVAVPLLVALNVATESQVNAWIPLVLALADNLLSAGNTTDRLRRTVYAVVGVLQAGGLVTVLLSDWHPEWIPVVAAVLSVGSAMMARFYVPTTTIIPATRPAPSWVNPWKQRRLL